MTATLDSGPARQPADGSGLREATPAPPDRPRWERPTLLLLLVGTAVLYLWNLSINGFGNAYYAAAVQAGTKSWTALLFGSLDPSNFITVDKPPVSLWVMALSGRIFGFSSWSMLVPNALMGVATVWLLYAGVRRVTGPGAALLAGAALALTPVAVLMFRFNNPDAALVLLVVAAGYCTVRAIENASTRWLLVAGVLLGFGFLAKMLQAFVVVPGLGLAYLVAAPAGLGRRIRQLVAAGVAIVVAAGWWLVVEWLWPVTDRPYIAGSTNNNSLQLAFGYNGLSRILGGGGNHIGGGGAARAADAGGAAGAVPFAPPGGFGGFAGFGGQAGPTRLFTAAIGGQVTWLLPAAILLLVAGLWTTRRAPRTDRTRASLLLWGGWAVVCAIVFSFMQGIFHPYYTVEMAPALAALVGIGGHELWKHRGSAAGRISMAATVALTAAWAWILLDRTPTFVPWLRWVVVVLALIAVIGLLIPSGVRRAAAIVTGIALLSGLAGPAAYAAQTVGTGHAGGMVNAGPAAQGADGFRGGRRFGAGGRPALAGTAPGGGANAAGRGTAGFGGAAAGFGPGGPGGMHGFGEAEATDPALVNLLKSTGTRWSAATIAAQGASSLELAGAGPIMAIGGFSGTDPVPTLAQFEAYVTGGQVRYFLPGNRMGGWGGRGGRGVGGEITTWVQQHYTATTVGGQTVYDLSRPTG
ncbi:ArnT family glycosyltransferase [Pseudonocardia acidicola]|uniref:Glycosyltransferase family 39 protein n=1 Tax=Pseudonocardia acidicola TaxID=2724939 RepID=A0ABX1SI28_9PSEU|nr:glycosyltransferase family 39 protein [Pseudonocardia acidicola]NMI00590.1 glycosyltransferase family 39 protein [Pseudonocardia acidicola]